MISKFKTPSAAMLVAAVLLLLVVGIVSLSSPMGSEEKPVRSDETPPEVVEEAFELMQEEPQNLEALKPYLVEEIREDLAQHGEKLKEFHPWPLMIFVESGKAEIASWEMEAWEKQSNSNKTRDEEAGDAINEVYLEHFHVEVDHDYIEAERTDKAFVDCVLYIPDLLDLHDVRYQTEEDVVETIRETAEDMEVGMYKRKKTVELKQEEGEWKLIRFHGVAEPGPNDEVTLEEAREDELIPSDVRLSDNFDMGDIIITDRMQVKEQQAKNAEEFEEIVEFVESWNDYVQDSTHDGYFEKYDFEIDFDDVKLEHFTPTSMYYEYSMQHLKLDIDMRQGRDVFDATIYFGFDKETRHEQDMTEDAIYAWQLYLASYFDELDLDDAANILADSIPVMRENVL